MTNWYVITGGPSSGKTTTVNLLRDRGYTTTIEHARHYLDLQRIAGRTVEEVRAKQRQFQRGVLDMQLAEEAPLDPDATVFLDRAVPDSLAYYRFLGLVAVIGLAIYGLIFFALIKLIPITLTLPGIAGLILTIGVAADANIVIFERIKEEARGGKSMLSAIAAGYRRGIATIIDRAPELAAVRQRPDVVAMRRALQPTA